LLLIVFYGFEQLFYGDAMEELLDLCVLFEALFGHLEKFGQDFVLCEKLPFRHVLLHR
jgi:hypothetical protein